MESQSCKQKVEKEAEMQDLYLIHHGTEGQQWGKRNGPPYPLNSDGKKALKTWVKVKRAEKKANKILEKQAKKEAKSSKKDSYKINVDKMTDDELRAATERLKAENAYQSAVNDMIKNKQTYDQLTAKKPNPLVKALSKNSDALLKEGVSALKGYLDKHKPKTAKDILKEQTERLNMEKDFYEAIKNNRNARESMNDARREYSNFTKTTTTNKNGETVEQLKETWKEARKKK